jgi:FMN phosphatase YigB (HAD superfamily)
MQECQIDVALLDFGGVIAEEGFADGIRSLAKQYGQEPDVLWRAGLQAVWDSGYVFGKADEAAFWALFRQRTGLEGDSAQWRETILSGFVVRPWMLDIASRLRSMGVRTAILSDQTDWLALLDARHGFSRYFEKVYNSFNYGMSKQEPAFFLMALEDLGVAPQRTLFVDDNQGNVSRARALGLQAILYETRPGFEQELSRICPEALQG